MKQFFVWGIFRVKARLFALRWDAFFYAALSFCLRLGTLSSLCGCKAEVTSGTQSWGGTYFKRLSADEQILRDKIVLVSELRCDKRLLISR